jgi:cobalamin biosynthesis protein CobD/CbiB
MDNHGRKRRLSQHQRQVRFLGGVFLAVMILATILLFWFLNRPNFTTR